MEPGARVGKYELLELLGRGSAGAVFRARDASGREVALKLLSSELTSLAAFRTRFARELRAALAVDHPNIARCLDAGEDRGVPFLVFELVDGGTLAGRLKTEGRLAWPEAARLLAPVASALAAIHAAGLVHRDVKPGNVLLDHEGTPKLADFGLVGTGDAGLSSSDELTRTGEILGTLEYLAPEQANASGAGVDGRADLYALGATLYHALVGAPPFEGEGYALVRRHLTEPPRRPSELVPGLPPELERLVLALLAKDPADRPANATEVARALAELGSEASGASVRTRVVTALGIVLALGVVATGAGLGLRARMHAANRAHARALGEKARGEIDRDPGAAANDLDQALPLADADAPERAGLTSLRALAAARLGDSDRVYVLANEALELDMRDAVAFLAEAEVERRSDASAALRNLDDALKLDPGLVWALLLRAELRLEAHDVAGAGKDADEAVAKAPGNARAHALLARVKLAALDRAGAITEASRALALDGRDARALAVRAEARAGKFEIDRALEDAERALALDATLARPWVVRALAAEVRMDHRAVVAAARRALELDPRSGDALALLASAGVSGGVPLDEARAAAERATGCAPGSSIVWRVHARYREMAGDHAGALEDADRALALDPGDALAWQERATLDCIRNDLAHGREATEHGLAITHDAPALWEALFIVEFQERHSHEALVAIDRAVELAPDDPSLRVNRGQLRLSLGDLDGARLDSARVRERDPHLPQGLFLHGRIALADRDVATARADLEELRKESDQFGAAGLAQNLARLVAAAGQ